jgi:hypothetical protein
MFEEITRGNASLRVRVSALRAAAQRESFHFTYRRNLARGSITACA